MTPEDAAPPRRIILSHLLGKHSRDLSRHFVNLVNIIAVFWTIDQQLTNVLAPRTSKVAQQSLMEFMRRNNPIFKDQLLNSKERVGRVGQAMSLDDGVRFVFSPLPRTCPCPC